MTAAVVVDASLAFKWIRSEPYTVEARDLLRQWLRDSTVRFVPPLFPYEIANILHRKARTPATTQADLERALGRRSMNTIDASTDPTLVDGWSLRNQVDWVPSSYLISGPS